MEKEKWSIAHLFSDLTTNLASLVRQELLLARNEMQSKISQVWTSSAFLIVGGAMLFAGFLVLLAAAIVGLSLVWPAWVAALAVGLVVVAVGAGFLLKGRDHMKAAKLKPERTISSIRRDIDFTKERLRRAS